MPRATARGSPGGTVVRMGWNTLHTDGPFGTATLRVDEPLENEPFLFVSTQPAFDGPNAWTLRLVWPLGSRRPQPHHFAPVAGAGHPGGTVPVHLHRAANEVVALLVDRYGTLTARNALRVKVLEDRAYGHTKAAEGYEANARREHDQAHRANLLAAAWSQPPHRTGAAVRLAGDWHGTLAEFLAMLDDLNSPADGTRAGSDPSALCS